MGRQLRWIDNGRRVALVAIAKMARAGLLVCAGLILGCNLAAAAEPKVVVTLKPVHALVAAVMDGAGAPDLLLDGAASPHTYALKPSDVRRLVEAHVVVRVSPGLEAFLERTLAGLPKRVVVVTLDAVPGLTLYPLRAGSGFEAHTHSGRGHTHGSTGRAKAGVDGHLWLDPNNARLIGLHMAEVLAAIAPEHAVRYRQNAVGLAAGLDALSAKLAQELKPVGKQPFLVFHDAYQYFERRFGLVSAGAVTVSPEVPPSVRRISQIRALLAAKGAVCVFSEPQFPSRTINTVIDGTTVRRGTLDPLGASLAAGPGLYAALLEGLARDLKVCLGGPG